MRRLPVGIVVALAPLVLATAACVPPGPPPARAEREPTTPAALPPGFHGRLVWTSARGGRRHIVRLDEHGEAPLTAAGELEDVYPRLSRDGTWVLFSRGRAPGVSELEPAHDDRGWITGEKTHERVRRPSLDWDVYRVPFDGSSPPERVAERGLWASWDEGRVVFVRDAKIVVANEREMTLFDGDAAPELENVDFREPTLAGDLLTFEEAVWRRQVGLLNLTTGKWTQIGGGRHISWSPRAGLAAWVDDHGNGGSAIVLTALSARSRTVGATVAVLDLPLPTSSEAAPRLSSDGHWLAFAVAPTPAVHVEHEGGVPPSARSDLDVYLWRVGDDASRVVRVTSDPANETWPDLLVAGAEAPPPSTRP
jgi:hypothetical protein